jgi:hypothetical protein
VLSPVIAGVTAVSVCLPGAAFAAAVRIDFDDLPRGTVVTNQYAEATLSSAAGAANYVLEFSTTVNGGGGSGPNILCTGPAPSPTQSGSVDCLRDTYVDFTHPVNNLTFWAIEANYPGVAAEFNIYEDGAYYQTVPLYGRGGPGSTFVDLSAFAHVTRLEIVHS